MRIPCTLDSKPLKPAPGHLGTNVRTLAIAAPVTRALVAVTPLAMGRTLAFTPADDAIDLLRSDTRALYTVDRTCGAATLVGNSGPSQLVGLLWKPLETYCSR